MTEKETKTTESRLRRLAQKHGMRLWKERQNTTNGYHGTPYGLADDRNLVVEMGCTLDEIGARLEAMKAD